MRKPAAGRTRRVRGTWRPPQAVPELTCYAIRRSGDAMLLDVPGERAQRAEDTDVVLVIGAQLETVALGNFQRKLQRVDRVQRQPGLEQRRLGVDVRGRDALQVESGNDEFRELALGRGLAC